MTKTHKTPALPTEFTIGDHIYELVPFLKEDESYVSGDVLVERAKELNANLGVEDDQFMLKHQDEIPQELRGKLYLVFPGWRDPSRPRYVACLDWWVGGRWCQRWYLGSRWDGRARLVRRRGSKPTAKPTATALPTEFTAGGRTYELVPFLKKGEGYVKGEVLVERAKEVGANLGEEDRQFMLEHQIEIPWELRGKCHLVFTIWCDTEGYWKVASLGWDVDRWHKSWNWLGHWGEDARLVRRKT